MRKRLLRTAAILMAALLLIAIVGCGGSDYGDKDEELKGEPPFPKINNFWVVDDAKVLSQETVKSGDYTLQQLKLDGVAEVVVLVKRGIKDPGKYATHYGRRLRLGKLGRSTSGGNNGVVWIIRPDAEPRMTISVGRGLPRFTTADYEKIMLAAKNELYANKFDKGVMKIIKGTDLVLREIYGKK